MSEIFQRCTVAFVDAAGGVAGYEWVEVAEHRLAEPAFLRWLALDQLHRRGPREPGLRAAIWVGKLSGEQCTEALMKAGKP